MNKVLLFLLFISIHFAAGAQTFPSGCTAPDSVKAAYKADAQRLALRRVFKFRAPEMDSTNIPATWTDTALNALVVLYNATTMPARDTVVSMLNIHSFAEGGLDSPFAFSMNRLTIYAPDTLAWMDDYKNGIIPTSDASINQFQTLYNLHLDTYIDLTFGLDGLEFTSDSNYNLHAVAANFMQAYPNSVAADMGAPGDGPDIFVDTVTDTYTQLTFKYGWEDCPVGCVFNRYWTFRCNFDCTVTYMGSTGDTLPWQPNSIAERELDGPVVYPNPFTDRIIVRNVSNGGTYEIFSAGGAIVQRGKLEDGRPIELNAPAGVYFLRLADREQSRVLKLLKE